MVGGRCRVPLSLERCSKLTVSLHSTDELGRVHGMYILVHVRTQQNEWDGVGVVVLHSVEGMWWSEDIWVGMR